MNEAKVKQDETLSEKEIEKKSPNSKSQISGTKQKRENETSNKNILPVKRSRVQEESDEPQSSKKTRYDNEQNVSNTSADLSAGNNKETEESLNKATLSANSVLVAKHYSSLKNKNIAVRDKSRILYMRNFNNWIKSILILEYIDKVKPKTHGSCLKVLDMCCGKGGDLFKWEKVEIAHLICTDLAEISVQHCQDRYKEMLKRNSEGKKRSPLFSAEFITADCTKVRLRKEFKDPSISLDLVSCQFAFHYCFESLQQAECMMKNASECLKPGGYFIGTIPDAYDLVSRWQKCDGNKFGNDIYNVEFFCDKLKPPLFGAKYHFQLEGVVNCPEFLVYLPVFRKLGLKFGLEMKLFERFDSFYERMKDRGMKLLSKIQALETYPPRYEVPLAGNAKEDYKHAKQYMQGVSRHREIGTLSQPEWEVTSLYAVFAFQKMNTVWNNEGKPEYEKL